jgi:hypothetical protein
MEAEDKNPSQKAVPERIYNPIKVMGFSAMFTFQLNIAGTPLP